MKSLKKAVGIFSVSVYLFASYTNVYANIFNDVNQNHTAYLSIKKMADLGIIVGDLQGNFKPDSYISKFDTIKILSKLVQDEDINLSTSKYNDTVLQYDKKYSRWDSSSNIDMVLLLEKGILKENDLNNFIIIDKNGKEQIRALSNEEIAYFLVAIENKQDVINQLSFNKIFEDEKNISEDKRNACYYMDSLNIIPAKDNCFKPKNAVSKAELAIILDKFLQHTNLTIQPKNVNLSYNHKNIQTRFVTIQNTFLESNSIQIKTGDETKTYSLIKDAKIYIDNNYATLSQINPNTNAEITIKDNFITKIDIKSNLKIKNVQNTQSKTVFGTIKNVSNESISLSYRDIDDNCFYSKEKIDIIPLSKDCKITKNGVNISSIEKDSLATVVLENKRATQIILEDDNTLFIGKILEKFNNKILVQTKDNKIFEIGFTENCQIIKNDLNASISSLRIGDLVTLNTQKDKIFKIYAKGVVSKKQGIVKSIKINDTYSTIELQDANNETNIYYANNLTTDIYSVRVLDKVDLYLDSSEIYAINILDRKYNKSFSGKLVEVGNNYIVVSIQHLNQSFSKKVFIDKDTIIFDYEHLKNKPFNTLKKGSNVYISLKDATNNIASNINIVSK